MEHPLGESKPGCLRVDFDRRFKLEFHGSKIAFDVGFNSLASFNRVFEETTGQAPTEYRTASSSAE